MISSKDIFLHQQMVESQERIDRAKTMSKDERYTIRANELFKKLETLNTNKSWEKSQTD